MKVEIVVEKVNNEIQLGFVKAKDFSLIILNITEAKELAAKLNKVLNESN